MTDARERLERAVFDALVLGDGRSHFDPDSRLVLDGFGLVQRIADAVERALAPEPPAPLKVWPGLEGKGMEKVLNAYRDAYKAARASGADSDAAVCTGYTAMAAHLWRALVASLSKAGKGDGIPETENIVRVGVNAVYRDDLAALADPYDGGGK